MFYGAADRPNIAMLPHRRRSPDSSGVFKRAGAMFFDGREGPSGRPRTQLSTCACTTMNGSLTIVTLLTEDLHFSEAQVSHAGELHANITALHAGRYGGGGVRSRGLMAGKSPRPEL
jgi:hypothetical protein